MCVCWYGGTISTCTCAFIYRAGQDPWLSKTHRQLLALYIYKSQCKCKEIIITLKLGDYNKKNPGYRVALTSKSLNDMIIFPALALSFFSPTKYQLQNFSAIKDVRWLP